MEKKKVKTYLVYTAATAVFIAVVYALFSSPSGEGDGSRNAGGPQGNLNIDLPEGEFSVLPDNKVTAYEDLAQSEEAQLRKLGVGEFDVNLSQMNNDSASQEQSVAKSDDEVNTSVANAMQAIQDLEKSRKASTKTSAPAPTSKYEQEQKQEAERRKQDLNDLRQRNENTQKALLSLLQSQQQGQQQGKVVAGNSLDDNTIDDRMETGGVSAIPDNHGDVATTLGHSRDRSGGFYGISHVDVPRNSIKACAYGKQEVGDGQSLRIRLIEPMMVSGQLVPAGSILSGVCRITTDRLQVSILSIEHSGVITRVALEVYDNDGLQGLYVPGSLELEAGREIGADVASSVGSTAASQTSMFSQQSAAEQIKADVGRGVVQGTFKFIGKKLQVIKVTVQDKHMLFLMTQKQ